MYAFPQSNASKPIIAFGKSFRENLVGFSSKALVTPMLDARIVPFE